jgi:excisionase family DNA binding protein
MIPKLTISTDQELADIIERVLSSQFEKYNIPTISLDKEPTKHQSNLIFIEEASIIIGLAKSTIRKKCHYGELPYYKPKNTKRLVFKRDELLEWMESGRHQRHSETPLENQLVYHPKNRKR